MNKILIVPVVIIIGLIGALLTVDFSQNSQTPQASNNLSPNKNDTSEQKSMVANSKKVDLSNQNLSELSINTINSNTSAVILDLSGNSLRTLPSEIGKFSKLEELYHQNNNLDSLPAEVGKFTNLRILDLSNNKITGIHGEIGHLRKLQILNLSDNGITDIPNEFYDLKNASEINLSENPFQQSKIDELQKQLPGVSFVF